MECSDKRESQGIDNLYHGAGRLVSIVVFCTNLTLLIVLSATAAAIIKLSFLPNYGKTGDFLWDSTDITIWTV